MKLRFDANLQYQQQAISAVADLFSGQTPKQSLVPIQTYSTPVIESQTSMLEQQTPGGAAAKRTASDENSESRAL